MVPLSERLLILGIPIGALLTLSHWERRDYPFRLVCGLIILLAVCLFHRQTERRQKQECPELVWLPWRKRVWLIMIPLLIFAPLGILSGITYGQPTTDPIIEEHIHLVIDFLYWFFSFTTVILIRVLDTRFSRWDPNQLRPAYAAIGGVSKMIWISEILLVLVIPVCVQRFLAYSAVSGFFSTLLESPLGIILAVSMFRWLVELRQQRERPELIWMPWYKRLCLTLIPLLIFAPLCVYFGLRYNDPVASPVIRGSAQFYHRLFYWLCSYMTVIVVRVLDNRFSHREAK